MSIVETIVTPTHQYYMKRKKQDIIDRIEALEGAKFSYEERAELMKLFKWQLARRVMTAHRNFKDAPTDVQP